jgi:hypothetical protein
MPSASRQPLAAGGRTRAPRPCWLMRVGVHGMSTPADSLTDPWHMRRNGRAMRQSRNRAMRPGRTTSPNTTHLQMTPGQRSGLRRRARSIPSTCRPRRPVRRCEFGSPSRAPWRSRQRPGQSRRYSWWENCPRGAFSRKMSAGERFPSRPGLSARTTRPTAQAGLKRRRTSRRASPCRCGRPTAPLAEPPRQTDGATSPSAAANEQPPLAEPPRQTDGATSPSAAANEQPPLSRGATVEHVTESVSPTPSALNSDAIAAFLERAQELLASGDIAAARLLLLRAAEARDPKAALALAATFDPIILQRIGAYGVVPEVPSARHWYEKAKEFGSEEASQRLEMLVRRQM